MDWKDVRAVRQLRVDLGRGFWVLRAVSESAFLIGMLHAVWRMLTWPFRGQIGEKGAGLSAMITELTRAIVLMLPWFALALIVRVAYVHLERRRATLIAEVTPARLL